MMAWVFAIVITASMGSFVQDLFLPMFLRRPEAPKQTEPTERSILAMLLDDMESLQLIRPPLRAPVKRGFVTRAFFSPSRIEHR